MRSGDPYHVQGLAPQRPADRAGAAPLGTFRPGKATVVEVPGAALGAEPQPPVMIDAGWLSAQLWRAVLGK